MAQPLPAEMKDTLLDLDLTARRFRMGRPAAAVLIVLVLTLTGNWVGVVARTAIPNSIAKWFGK